MAEFISRTVPRFGVYKRSQGRIARQVTFAALAIVASAAGAWKLNAVAGNRIWARYAIPLVVCWPLGLWVSLSGGESCRSFADFLISVEAEMNKVSWPSRGELFRASLVVIVVIFLLAAILFVYDIVLELVAGLILVSGLSEFQDVDSLSRRS